MNQLNNHNTALTSSVNDLLDEILTDALKNGNQKLFDKLNTRLDGQQARVNSVMQNQTQATQAATADHSLVVQLLKSHNKMATVVNNNSRTERDLIKQLKDVHINAYDLIQAMENECGTTISKMIKQMINQKTILAIQTVLDSIERDKLDIEETSNSLIAKISTFQKYFIFGLAGLVIVSSIPIWWVKLLSGVLILIGGYFYEK